MKSLWQESVNKPNFKQLQENIKCDVLIIGGGITGILTAFFLEKNHVDYILVEKDEICSGTTGNTTAKITAQHGLIYNKIIKSNGEDAAKLYLDANLNAVEMYKDLCKNIECDFEEKNNYVYSLYDRKRLEDEVIALEKLHYKAEFVNTLNLPFKTLGAVKFYNQAQFHPLKFIFEISKGLKIFENTKVTEIKDNTAVTNNG